jgi:hypothetical protein
MSFRTLARLAFAGALAIAAARLTVAPVYAGGGCPVWDDYCVGTVGCAYVTCLGGFCFYQGGSLSCTFGCAGQQCGA